MKDLASLCEFRDRRGHGHQLPPIPDLDRKAGDDVLELLRVLNRDRRKTMVMVTHDPQAATAAPRVVHLDKGRLIGEAAA